MCIYKLQETLFEGYLYSSNECGQWDRGFFRLKQHDYVMLLEEHTSHHSTCAARVMDVSRCLVQEGAKVCDASRSFSLMMPGECGVYMQADTTEEASVWIELLSVRDFCPLSSCILAPPICLQAVNRARVPYYQSC